MSWLQALVLGIVQGATEFLPISSSGHLVLVPWLLGWEFEPASYLPFTVVVHWGTLTAVLVSLRRELWSVIRAAVQGLWDRRPLGSAEARLAWLLALATAPAALAGVLFEQQVEQAFGAPSTVALLLLGTAALLLVGELLIAGRLAAERAAGAPPASAHQPGERLASDQRRGLTKLSAPDALLIGLAQALALLPGISRSGATMAAGVGRGLSRPSAARFSFLLAVPIMLGAGLVSLADLGGQAGARALVLPLLVGFSSAAAVGMLSIRWLLAYLARGSLRGFAVYCALAGLAALALSACQRQTAPAPAAPEPTPFPEITTTPSFQGWVVERILDFRQQAPGALPLGFGVRVEAYPLALEQVEVNSFALMVSSAEPPPGWFATPLGWEAVVFAVHPENRVRRLDREQLLGIFTGQIWNWSDLGGADLEIEPVIPLPGDELREYLAQAMMEGHPFTSAALLGPTPELTVPMVADRPGAIAVLPLTAINGQVRPLLVDGVAARPGSVASGEYDLRVEVLAYAPEEPSGQVREWLVWQQSQGNAGTEQ